MRACTREGSPLTTRPQLVLEPRLEGRSETARAGRMAEVANGTVRVGDWVRELPARHFQPCSCCLCYPPAGTRPIYRVRRIDIERGRQYLRLGGEHHYPAEEFERVDPPPAKGRGEWVIGSGPTVSAPISRDAMRWDPQRTRGPGADT